MAGRRKQTMNIGKWLLIWAGAVAGLLAGWSCIALALWFFAMIPRFHGAHSFIVLLLAGLFLVLPAFLMAGFAVGMSCAFFWHSIVTKEQLESWRIGVLIVLFLPLFWLGFVYGLAATCLLAPLVIKKFNSGIAIGMDWWPKRRWRHWFGLANDWECDKNQR